MEGRLRDLESDESVFYSLRKSVHRGLWFVLGDTIMIAFTIDKGRDSGEEGE